jgi:hypothetical protein
VEGGGRICGRKERNEETRKGKERKNKRKRNKNERRMNGRKNVKVNIWKEGNNGYKQN